MDKEEPLLCPFCQSILKIPWTIDTGKTFGICDKHGAVKLPGKPKEIEPIDKPKEDKCTG